MKTRLLVVLALVVLVQLSANIAFAQMQDRIDLSKPWRFNTDPTNAGQKKGWQKPDFNTSGWRDIKVPGIWEDQNVNQRNLYYKSLGLPKGYDGYAWYRTNVVIPNEWKGKDVYLNLGKIDDLDWTYFNGSLIGQMSTRRDSYSFYRSYEVPRELIKYGAQNVIAVRALDFGNSGGIASGPVSITTQGPEAAAGAPAANSSSPIPQTTSQDKVQVPGNVVVEKGETVKSAVAVTGSVTVRGHVTGDATAVMGNIYIQDGGVVDGDAVAVGGSVIRSGTGIVRGATTTVGGWKGFSFTPWAWSGTTLFFGIWAEIAYALGMAVLAALVVALFPTRIEVVANTTLNQPARAALYGFVGGMLIVPIAIVLLFTIIGIPLLPVEILLVVIALIVAQVAAGLAVGKRLIAALNKPAISPVLSTAIGVILLGVIKMVPVIGGLLVFVLCLLAFGAVIMTGFGTHGEWFANRFRKTTPNTPPTPPVPPAPPQQGNDILPY